LELLPLLPLLMLPPPSHTNFLIQSSSSRTWALQGIMSVTTVANAASVAFAAAFAASLLLG